MARDFGRAKRDLEFERSLEAQVSDSSIRMEAWLDDQQSSPQEKAERNEQLLQLAAALALSTSGELVATCGPGVVLWDRQSDESPAARRCRADHVGRLRERERVYCIERFAPEFPGLLALRSFQVWRQGDDGNYVLVGSPTSQRDADCWVTELESQQHKQIYGIQRVR